MTTPSSLTPIGRTVGIVGFGQFGQLVPALLPKRRSVKVFDVKDRRQEARQLGCAFASFEEVCACDVVVFAVPVQALREVLRKAAPHIKPGALAIEVSSVKLLPSRWMQEELPAGCSILCLHPLFGPQSARIGLAGRKLVVCPVRGAEHRAIARLAALKGLVVRVSTPELHDREMAHVQGLTHLIARAIIKTGRPHLALQTQPYFHLMDLCSLVEHDTDELFAAIELMNPYAREVVRAFVKNVTEIDAALEDAKNGSR